jgi:hypothetical protein
MKKLIIFLLVVITFIISSFVSTEAYYLDTDTYTIYDNAGSSNDYIAVTLNVPSESYVLTINLLPNEYHTLSNSTIEARITMYNNVLDEWFTWSWTGFVDSYIGGYHKIYWERLGIQDAINAGAYDSITITIPQSWTDGVAPANYKTDLEAYTIPAFDEFNYKVVYMDQLSQYADYIFTTIPPDPPNPTKEGYTFIGWFKADGTRYNFNYAIPLEEMVLDTELSGGFNAGYQFYLYSRYVSSSTVDTDIEEFDTNLPEGIEDLLQGIGFNNASGFIVLYVILSLGIIILFLSFHLGAFPIIISLIGITAGFIFLGLLPLWFIIIITLVLATVFFWSMKGGVNNE